MSELVGTRLWLDQRKGVRRRPAPVARLPARLLTIRTMLRTVPLGVVASNPSCTRAWGRQPHLPGAALSKVSARALAELLCAFLQVPGPLAPDCIFRKASEDDCWGVRGFPTTFAIRVWSPLSPHLRTLRMSTPPLWPQRAAMAGDTFQRVVAICAWVAGFRAFMIVRRCDGVALRDDVLAAVDPARLRILTNTCVPAPVLSRARVRARADDLETLSRRIVNMFTSYSRRRCHTTQDHLQRRHRWGKRTQAHSVVPP